jgi:hypothetical protein
MTERDQQYRTYVEEHRGAEPLRVCAAFSVHPQVFGTSACTFERRTGYFRREELRPSRRLRRRRLLPQASVNKKSRPTRGGSHKYFRKD